MRARLVVCLVSVVGFLAAWPTMAAAETVNCRRVSRPPTTISTPGIYCLDRNLSFDSASGTAVAIEADDVVLDLNGWTLDGTAAGTATNAIGIGSSGRSNITIRNGTIRGFRAGIQIVDAAGSGGHVVEGIRADRNTSEGIAVGGRGARVCGNQIVGTGGSTLPSVRRPYGIVVRAPGGLVADNLVVDTIPETSSFGYGIHATASDGIVIEGNRILNRTLSAGRTFGVIVPFSQDVHVVANRISRMTEGVHYSSGATGKYRDNLTTGVTVPYAGTGTDAGNNN